MDELSPPGARSSSSVVADTHAILWDLYSPERPSAAARAALNLATNATIYVSAISLVELTYLIENGRFTEATFDRTVAILEGSSTGFSLVPVSSDVARAMQQVPRKLVPDMPDRIIAATAIHLALPLVTADSQIRASGIATIW